MYELRRYRKKIRGLPCGATCGRTERASMILVPNFHPLPPPPPPNLHSAVKERIIHLPLRSAVSPGKILEKPWRKYSETDDYMQDLPSFVFR